MQAKMAEKLSDAIAKEMEKQTMNRKARGRKVFHLPRFGGETGFFLGVLRVLRLKPRSIANWRMHLTLTDKDFKPEFKSEITAMPGGEQVKLCYDCGTCTGACPVSESGSGFDPRKILRMIKTGMKDQLLGSDAIWHCTHCDTCLFVCPQNVRFSAVVDVLREMADPAGICLRRRY